MLKILKRLYEDTALHNSYLILALNFLAHIQARQSLQKRYSAYHGAALSYNFEGVEGLNDSSIRYHALSQYIIIPFES
jgi:hypothetical protein